ncbi:MAG: type I-E CRISPR-associated protein Cse2/CasB [Thermodesulfobacteriota bacterium]
MSKKYLQFKKNSTELVELTSWMEWLSKNGRGERASLRRCGTLNEVVFSPAYHRLCSTLARIGEVDDEGLALVVGLAARIKNDNSAGRIAEQMATGKPDGSARVSGLRFRRLLKIKGREELYCAMNRVISLLGASVNLQSLARSVYLWNDRYIDIRKEWAFDYYSKAPSEP